MDMRGQHGNRVGQVDAYGNPIQQQATDVYGNPVHQTTAHGVPHQATYGHEVNEGIGGNVTGAGHGYGVGGQPQMTRPDEQHRGGGILRRSGSNSSSSSSEDDGMGGRRKKGLKEKIKEKLPGGHKTDDYGQQQQHGYGQGTTGTGYGGTHTTAGATGVHHEPEKKGMMEKIKEKLPGGHKTDDYEQQQHGYGQGTTGTGYGGTTTTTGATGVYHEPEKKGMMEKIKEKLPGHH